MQRSFNLELLNGMSVVATISSLMLMTLLLLPSAVQHLSLAAAPVALASGSPPPGPSAR
jgi:hypothetical protein